ncbi:MAG TPA: hypothetical protein VKB69_07915 [Micromonosporaceae bacterium]|nr:hypothetical protein [Micromonosporaceae bacterium]
MGRSAGTARAAGPCPAARAILTWDAADRSDILWRNEAAKGDGPWMPIETHHMTPVGQT